MCMCMPSYIQPSMPANPVLVHLDQIELHFIHVALRETEKRVIRVVHSIPYFQLSNAKHVLRPDSSIRNESVRYLDLQHELTL